MNPQQIREAEERLKAAGLPVKKHLPIATGYSYSHCRRLLKATPVPQVTRPEPRPMQLDYETFERPSWKPGWAFYAVYSFALLATGAGLFQVLLWLRFAASH